MNDRELRRLGRADLIDIVYELRKRLEQSEAQVRELQGSLGKRDLDVASAGSIAEAALKVNHIFEDAQAAADQYLDSIKAATAGAKEHVEAAERRSQAVLEDAERQAAGIVREAEAKAEVIVGTAEMQASEKWAEFERRARQLVAANDELRSLVGGGR